MSEILQIRRGVTQINDVTNIQFHTYTPYTTSFNNDDEIRITIQSRDVCVQPSESYLYVEFKASVVKDEDVETDAVFSYFSALAFFSEMRYELNGIEIDRCKLPMITSQLKTMTACKSSDYNDAFSLTWLDGQKISNSTYQLMIPLKFVFGFCDDYEKVLLNSKHELILMRSHVDNNAYISSTTPVKFNITRVQWKVPHVSLSNRAKSDMLKIVDRKENLPLAFRSWDLYDLPNVPQTTRNVWSVKTTTQASKPRYVVVAFQTNRNNVTSANPRFFDHCNISNIRLYLNNERYPYDDMNLDYENDDFCQTINMLDQIQNGYYNGMYPVSPTTSLDFIHKKEIAVFLFDCSRSDESIQNGMVDVRIEMDARKNFPADTAAYCLIIHDNLIQYCPATGVVQRTAV